VRPRSGYRDRVAVSYGWWWRATAGPSAWTRRLPVIVLAVVGLLVSLNLSFFQYHLIDSVWDPFFGAACSAAVLTSALSRSLPVHDAALGAFAYLVEMALEAAGGTGRWRDRPWLPLLLGLTAAGMAAVSLGLILVQALMVHHFCTLCLVSAGISLIVPVLVVHEVRAAVREVRHGRRRGASWWRALRGDTGGGVR
jgi:uncharacterized membrane protein